jgi:hypothetical protein
LTVANALAALRRHTYSSLEISDSAQNIAKNLDALQGFAGKITAVATTDVGNNLSITGAQYQKDGAILAIWGAGNGQTVTVTAAKASQVGTLAAYVTSASVADSRTNIQSHLDDLQAAATSGVLHEIVQTGVAGNLTITATQLANDQTALGKIKNQAYSLAITNASVSDVLGLGASPALSTNSKVKAISIVDTTDAIGGRLDDLQRVGLRIKSITQTDVAEHLTVTGDQYQHDKLVLGKFITADMLDVIDASAAQAKALAADHKVLTADIQDTASSISRNWSLLQNLTDSLTSVQVTDDQNAIRVTADQFAGSDTLLGKFSDTAQHSYKLAVTQVSAGTATAVASAHNVDSVEVSDTSANVVANLGALETLAGQNKLTSVTLTTPQTAMSMDVTRLQDAAGTATQDVLDLVKGGNYRLAVTGAATSDVADLASNKRIVSFTINDSSANITSGLDALYHLGSRLGKIQQTDTGTVFELTQTQMDSRSSVLAKVDGGYTANLTAVTAAKAISDAKNLHVGQVTVADSGRNILAHWSDLLSLGTTLNSINKSDAGALTLTADNYQLGVRDNLVAKFGGGTTFAVTGATVAEAQTIAGDQAVTQIDMTDETATIQDKLPALETLVAGGKIHSITNQTPTVSMSLDAADLADAQSVLGLIKGGSYSLSLTGVDVANAKTLVTANHKIVNLAVHGDSASIVSNLSDLTSLGKKLATITQTDAPAETLALTGAAFEQNAGTLAKIQGGFLAVLSQVTASKAATFATNSSVSSLSVSDTGANLSGAWDSLAQLGSKLTQVTQSDSSNLQLNVTDWSNAQDLRNKFAAEPPVSLSGVHVSDVSNLATVDSVKAIQVQDTASALAASLGDLGTQAKVTQLVLDDPTVAMGMTAQTYADSATILSKVKNNQYSVDLSQVTANAATTTLASDSHVASMDVSDSSSEIGSHFDALAAATNLNSISLTDQGGTITATAAQILNNTSTLDRISGTFQLAATGAAMADLADLANVAEVTSVAISDTSDNVSTNFSDILALGSSVAQLHLTDSSPVLSLSEADWTAGSGALATIPDTYQVDVTDTVAGDAQAVAANGTVRHVTVADAASNIAGQWDTLVGLYNAGKLTGISLTDEDSLTLSSDQQTAGATMIADLMPDETILTA